MPGFGEENLVLREQRRAVRFRQPQGRGAEVRDAALDRSPGGGRRRPDVCTIEVQRGVEILAGQVLRVRVQRVDALLDRQLAHEVGQVGEVLKASARVSPAALAASAVATSCAVTRLTVSNGVPSR